MAASKAEVPALAGLNVIALAEDRDGGVWAGTRDGQVWHGQQGNWAAQTNYSQTKAITAILHDTEGAMWIGTEGRGSLSVQRWRALSL